MLNYQKCYVCDCEDKEVTRKLFSALISYSDAFSLLYFRRNEDEKLKKTVREVKKKLEKNRIGAENVYKWPLTEQLPMDKPICRLVTYKSDIELYPILTEIGCLWDWDYPVYPMDIAFYKDGYAWFESCAHEQMNNLYLGESNNYPKISDLESLGIKLENRGSVSQEELFFNKHALLGSFMSKERVDNKDEQRTSFFELFDQKGYRLSLNASTGQITLDVDEAGLKMLADQLNVLSNSSVPTGASINFCHSLESDQGNLSFVIKKM